MEEFEKSSKDHFLWLICENSLILNVKKLLVKLKLTLLRCSQMRIYLKKTASVNCMTLKI